MAGINAFQAQGATPQGGAPAGPGSGPQAGAAQEDEGAEGAAGQDNSIEETEEASPEEQALYDRFVTRAMQLITDDNFFPKVVEMLKAADDPREGLAQTAASLVFRVVQMAKESGQNLTQDVLMNAGREVFENLADLATTLKIHDFTNDTQALDGAFYRAMDHFRILMTKNGMANPEVAKRDLQTLQDLDASGKLGVGLDRLTGGQSAQGGPQAPMDEEG